MLGGGRFAPGWEGAAEVVVFCPCPTLSSSLLPPLSSAGPCCPVRSLRTRSAVGTKRVTSALGVMICGLAEMVAAPDWPATPECAGTLVMFARFSMVWAWPEGFRGVGAVPGGGGTCSAVGRIVRGREGGDSMEGAV